MRVREDVDDDDDDEEDEEEYNDEEEENAVSLTHHPLQLSLVAIHVQCRKGMRGRLTSQ